MTVSSVQNVQSGPELAIVSKMSKRAWQSEVSASCAGNPVRGIQ